MENVLGVVKWYDPAKAYGFISSHDGTDVFVHRKGFASDCFREELIEGQEVSFQVRQGPKGPEAIEVRVTKESNNPPRRRSESDSFGFSQRGGSSRSHDGRSFDRSDRREFSSRDFSGKDSNRPAKPKFTGVLPSGLVAAEIVSVDQNRRFAFAKTVEGSIDVYIHGQFLQNGLSNARRGDKVFVELSEGERGPRAVKVSLSGSQRWSGGFD